MKKLITTALASAMVLSMAATSFAVVADINDNIHTANNSGLVGADNKTSYAYGTTLYFPLVSDTNTAVDSYDDVKGTAIKQTWEMNGSAISKVEIIKKKATDNNYYYFLSVATKDSTSTKATDVAGEIKLKKSGTNGFETGVNLGFTLAFPVAADTNEILDEVQLHKFAGDEEDVINFDGGYFTVNTVGQGDLLISSNTKFNSELASWNPQANLDFITFNNPSFNKIGELTINAPAGSFLYVLNSDKTFGKVNATYDEYEEAFKLKTRTLGSYVISDVALKTSAGSTDNGSKPNPGTGAIA